MGFLIAYTRALNGDGRKYAICKTSPDQTVLAKVFIKFEHFFMKLFGQNVLYEYNVKTKLFKL